MLDNLTFIQIGDYFECVKQLIKLGYTELVEDYLAVDKIKKIILNYEFCDDIEDYIIVTNFNSLYNKALDGDELNNVIHNFEMYSKDIVRNIIDGNESTEDLEEYRDLLESISDFFEVDISYELDDLDNAIDDLFKKELEGEPYDDYDEDLYRESRFDSYSGEEQDVQIDNLFDSIFD